MKQLLLFLLLAGCAKSVPAPAPPVAPVTTAVNIAFVNESTVVSDAAASQAVADIQTQLSRDFMAAWGLPTSTSYYPKDGSGGSPTASSWVVYIKDDTDRAGASGYHVATNPPMAFVFARTAGSFWTVTLSHEALEMRVDPGLNVEVQDTAIRPPLSIFEEVGDPVEATTYTVGSTAVSDFVFPSWFTPAGVAPFDQMGQVTAPFQVLFGGSLP